MTIEELKQQFPDATTDTWHRHLRGGGWVQNTAQVDDTVYVGPSAVVHGNANITGQARIEDFGQVGGNTWVGDYAIIHDHACVQDFAQVVDKAQICDYVRVADHAFLGGSARACENTRIEGYARVLGRALLEWRVQVCGQAQVGDCARLSDGILTGVAFTIAGSQEPVTLCSPTTVAIGSLIFPFHQKQEIAKELAKRRYKEAEVREYLDYVRLCKKRAQAMLAAGTFVPRKEDDADD